jgi:hypothetical protein
LLSPIYTGVLAGDAAYQAGPRTYWISLALVHACCWLFLILTAVLLPRVWREDPGEKRVAHRWLWRFGYTPGWRRTFRRRLEVNPIYALAGRLRWPHFVFWTLVTLVAVNVYWIAVGSRTVPGAVQFHSNFAYALIFTNRVWITVMACHFLLEARRSGALELFLTSPLPVRTFLRGHWRALVNYFGWPVFVIGLLHVGYVVGNWLQVSGRPGLAPGSILPFYIASAAGSYVNFLSDVVALCAVGAWWSVSLRKPAFALLLTFGFVILLPWAVGYYLPGATELVPRRLVAWIHSLEWVKKWLPDGLLGYSVGRSAAWVGKNLLFTVWALTCLRRRLRLAAAQTGDRAGGRAGAGWRWVLQRFRVRRPAPAVSGPA